MLCAGARSEVAVDVAVTHAYRYDEMNLKKDAHIICMSMTEGRDAQCPLHKARAAAVRGRRPEKKEELQPMRSRNRSCDWRGLRAASDEEAEVRSRLLLWKQNEKNKVIKAAEDAELRRLAARDQPP